MTAPPRFKTDYYGGALMTFIGLMAVYAGIGYRVGSLNHMGPGFFPVALGVLLAVTGVLIALSARGEADEPTKKSLHGHIHGMPDLRGGACIVIGTLAFIGLGKYGGLVPAAFAITFISALGDRKNTLLQSLLLALMMSAIAVIVFWWALQMQLPLFQWGA